MTSIRDKITNIFNNYFISIADTVNSDKNKYVNTSMANPIKFLTTILEYPFQNKLAVCLYL